MESFVREIRNIFNKLIYNSRSNWEGMYESGLWNVLDSENEKKRHFVIADVIRRQFPQGARVLDVGCGLGTLYGILKGPVRYRYVGLDLSESAVRQAADKFKGDDACEFVQADFEAYRSSEPFDTVVFNEVLYYFPVSHFHSVLSQGYDLLGGKDPRLIVSMTGNPKARWLWKKMARIAKPLEEHKVSVPGTVTVWTVRSYPGSPKPPLKGLTAR